MTFYNIIVQHGQSLTDIAMKEYGTVDGILWLQEDNAGIADLNSDPAEGTVLYIRDKPDVKDIRILNYVRKGRVLQVIRYLGGALVTVRNSSGSYLETANPGDVVIVPDTPFTDADGTFRNVPASTAIAAQTLAESIALASAQTIYNDLNETQAEGIAALLTQEQLSVINQIKILNFTYYG